MDLIKITTENQNSSNLAIEVVNYLDQYDLTNDNIIRCTTNNCLTMVTTAKILNIWRIPCVLHI